MSDVDVKLDALEAEMTRTLRPVVTANLLIERDRTHGNYEDHVAATWYIKEAIRNFCRKGEAIAPFDNLSYAQRESLDMIAHKIGRILAGDPDFRDHWDDIAGYAKLVADRCTK